MSKRTPAGGEIHPIQSAVRFLLKRACDRGLLVFLSSPSDGWIYQGTFRELIGGHVLVDARRLSGEGPIVPAMQVVLTFSDGEGTSVGVSSVGRFAAARGEDGLDRFVLLAPTQLATERGRRVYRVPTEEMKTLRASLGAREGRLIPAEVHDLSLTGVSLHVAEALEHGLELHDETSVALAFEGQSLVLEAVVRRLGDRQLALCFHRIINPEQAPELLRRIVSRVEGRFLRSRIRPADEGDQ